MEYVVKDGKKLRKGYTTGICGTAAALAAATGLLTGEIPFSVTIKTPSEVELTLFPEACQLHQDFASCAIRKDSGDDPDVTHGMLIFATVRLLQEEKIEILGGEGVGRVTKPGLDQPVGNAAINSAPRRSITKALQGLKERSHYQGGFQVAISIPGGDEVAKRTFNPRLGIVGGLSVLGTTGIVEPMSESAILDTIKTELRVRRMEGRETLLLTPGNYGREFVKNGVNHDADSVKCSNFIGDAIDYAIELGFREILLVGHGGKLFKLAGGIMQTHSRFGDCRFEILAAHAALSGADQETILRISQGVTVEQMLSAISEPLVLEKTLQSLMKAIDTNLSARVMGKAQIGCIVYTSKMGIVGYTPFGRTLGEQMGFCFA